jgi:hypothetical protein
LNFLEQLAAEWYEYSGYFVRTNIRTRKRDKGGWDMELDVLAYMPSTKELLHIEPSGDADSWAERKNRYLKKKFILTKEEYIKIIEADVSSIRRIAIVGQTRTTTTDLNWGEGIVVVLIPDFIKTITSTLKGRNPMSESVPEGFPILRSMQMALHYS